MVGGAPRIRFFKSKEDWEKNTIDAASMSIEEMQVCPHRIESTRVSFSSCSPVRIFSVTILALLSPMLPCLLPLPPLSLVPIYLNFLALGTVAQDER